MKNKLLNPPLIEAIIELRWNLSNQNNAISDPNYNFLIGMFYNKIKKDYPLRINLPLSVIPPEMMPYSVQYQFRRNENEWPVVQIGLGILTINETKNYSWDNNFELIVKNIIESFIEVYPEKESLKIQDLKLRYINSIDLEKYNSNLFDFFNKFLKTNISLSEELFLNGKIKNEINGYDFQFSYPLNKIDGVILFKFTKGKVNNKDTLIWEISVNSILQKVLIGNNLYNWLSEAHIIAEETFFTFIRGELERSFDNE